MLQILQWCHAGMILVSVIKLPRLIHFVDGITLVCGRVKRGNLLLQLDLANLVVDVTVDGRLGSRISVCHFLCFKLRAAK